MNTASTFFRIACIVIAAVFISSCTEPFMDPDHQMEISELPPPPGSVMDMSVRTESASRTLSPDWIYQARKHYLRLFFELYSREHFLTSRFFVRGSELTITGLAGGRVPLSGEYSGGREVDRYFRQLWRELDIREVDVQYQLAENDYVSSHVQIRAEVVSTGAEIDLETVFLFRFGRSGYISEARMYYDTQAWTRAFGGNADGRLFTDIRNPDDSYEIGVNVDGVAEKVDTLYDLFYAGDIPAVFELLSDDAAVYFKGDPQSYPFAGSYEGKNEILSFVGNLGGTAEPVFVERFIVSEGNRADVILYEEWRVFSTGKIYRVHTVNSWTADAEGRLLGFSNFPDSLEIALAYIQ